MKTKQETVLPLFTGFYESIFDESESWHDREEDYLLTERGATKEQIEDYLEACDESKASKEVAEYIAECFERLWNSEFKTKIKIEFQELDSPKYYNYSNDRIFCNIEFDAKEVSRIVLENKEEFKNFLHENFTAYDGFYPSYSNDLEEWNLEDISEFDANETWTIFSFLCKLKKLDEMSLLNECENIHEVYSNAVIYPPGEL